MSQLVRRASRASAIAAGIVSLVASSAQAEDPFRSTPSLNIPSSAVRSRVWAGGAEIGALTMALRGSRRKSAAAVDPHWLPPKPRISAWEGHAGVSLDVSSRDVLGLSAVALVERRRPLGLVSHGRSMASRAMAITVDWTRADQLRVSAGWFASGPRGVRLPGDRASERGNGALPDAKGIRLAVGMFDKSGVRGNGAWIGLDARVQQVYEVGAVPERRSLGVNDARLGIAFQTPF